MVPTLPSKKKRTKKRSNKESVCPFFFFLMYVLITVGLVIHALFVVYPWLEGSIGWLVSETCMTKVDANDGVRRVKRGQETIGELITIRSKFFTTCVIENEPLAS